MKKEVAAPKSFFFNLGNLLIFITKITIVKSFIVGELVTYNAHVCCMYVPRISYLQISFNSSFFCLENLIFLIILINKQTTCAWARSG